MCSCNRWSTKTALTLMMLMTVTECVPYASTFCILTYSNLCVDFYNSKLADKNFLKFCCNYI